MLRAYTRHQCQFQTKELIHTIQELGFVRNLEKSQLEPTQKNRLSGLPFRFDTGKSLSNRKEVENSRKFCSGHGDRITNNLKVAYVPDRCTSIPRKDNTNGSVIYAPFQWYLKTNWQYPQSLDLKIPVSNLLKKHLQWWKDPKYKNGLSFTSTGTQYPYFHRCVKSGLRSSVRKHDSQWQLERSRNYFISMSYS